MLTHVDEKNQPTMVDITNKSMSTRVAKAQSLVQLPEEMKQYLRNKELHLKKGPVFQTAIIAGTMAVKKTYEMIPFCHQIPIESCHFDIKIDENHLVSIQCEVKTSYKTGVEMEALSGAMVAALAVYDMCKAVSHNIAIRETKLLSKTGGKRWVLDRPVYGLVLTGGKSQRMQRDKALLNYKGIPHAQYIYDVLSPYCDKVYLSARKGQWQGTPLADLPMIYDKTEDVGPLGGILAAFAKHPDVNWLVVACDLPHFNERTVQTLLEQHRKEVIATAFRNSEKGFAEPLCTLYTPEARGVFQQSLADGVLCPVKILKNSQVHCVDQGAGIDLANVNTREEFEVLKNEIN